MIEQMINQASNLPKYAKGALHCKIIETTRQLVINLPEGQLAERCDSAIIFMKNKSWGIQSEPPWSDFNQYKRQRNNDANSSDHPVKYYIQAVLAAFRGDSEAVFHHAIDSFYYTCDWYPNEVPANLNNINHDQICQLFASDLQKISDAADAESWTNLTPVPKDFW